MDPQQVAELETARDLANQVHTEIAAQHWLTAAKIARRAVTLPGNDRDAALWGELGLALLRTQDFLGANSALDTAVQVNRYRADLWRLKAQALAAQARLDDAKTGQQRLDAASVAWDDAEIYTGSVTGKLEILAEHCDALLAAGRWQAAEGLIRQAEELAANAPGWAERRAQAQLGPFAERYAAAMQASDFAAAIAACDEALRVVPNAPGWAEQRAQAADAQIAAEQERQRRDRLIPARLQSLGFVLAPNVDAIIPPTVEVPAGPFTMGSDKRRDREAQDDEPQIALNLAAFHIGVYPVTVAEYACALAAKAKDVSQPEDWAAQQQHPDHPVVEVSWRAAVAYAAWLSEVTGEVWRLPTEAEWEKAARGTDGRIYPWGNQWDKARANTRNGGPGTTTPVGKYAEKGDASPYGCHDMAGNVWEWTSSIYRQCYDRNNSEDDSDRTSDRVLRGGSWDSNPRGARAAFRSGSDWSIWGSGRGFRLARGRVGW